MASRGFLGAGDLYIARYDSATQAFLEFEGPFESTKFEIKPNSELKEMSSRGRSTYGQVIESVPLPKPSDFNVTLAEVNKESLTLALFGTSTALAQGSGTITDEVVTLTAAKMDKWVQLSKQNITDAGFVVTNNAASTTYVEGTDYIVNRRLGMLKVLDAGAIPNTEAIKVDFGYSAISGSLISGSTQTQLRAKFKLDGVNFADGSAVICNVWEASLTPDSAFDFLQNDFAEIELKGRLKTPAGKTEPFTVELRA